MVEIRYTGDVLWDRIEQAVEKVRDRLNRFCAAMEQASIPYAVVGGNAVQVWVAQVDEGAIRNTRDVDILIDRDSLDEAIFAAKEHGFHYHVVNGVSLFLDGEDNKPSEAVHLVFAGELVKPHETTPTPTLDEVEFVKSTRTVSLESLVLMKLTSHRLKDRVHIQDMIQVGLIDETWTDHFEEPLKSRLQELLDDPYG
ncbi:MAG: hypothetical protein RH917_02600 [Lacipirellulaceae bacterium]